MPVVQAVPALVVPTMAAVGVDVPVAPGSPALPAPLLVMTVDVAVTAASAGIKCLEQHLELWTDSYLVHIMG